MLGIPQAESLGAREKWLVERLQNYRDLDLEIEGCHAALASDIELPSITIRPPEDDDPHVGAAYRQPLKEYQKEISETIEKYVLNTWRYVTVERVHKALRDTYSDDPHEDYAIRDAFDATRSLTEERVELTPTERAVAQHEEMQDRVRNKMVILQRQKRVIGTALGQLGKYYPEWHDLLKRRYVLGEKFVSYLASTGMSEKLYRNERRRALRKFDKLAVGLI